MIIDSLIFYILCTSSVLIYGIGLKKMILTSKNINNYLFDIIRAIIIACLTTVTTWLANSYILVKIDLIELFPLITILIYLFFAEFVTFIMSKGNTIELSEIVLIFPTVLIALTESYSLLQALIITFCSIISFFILIPIIFAIRERIKLSYPLKEFKSGALLFISIAVIICALFATNISWLNLWSLK